MNATVAALLGLTLAQPPAPDYYPLTARNITLPIQYTTADRNAIRKVMLFASADRGQTWPLVATALPDKTEFTYTAPKDGVYWFHIVIVDRNGKQDPANLTAEPPAMKVLVDTARPAVAFTGDRRNGEEVIVEWRVDDEFPNDAATKAYFRRADGSPDDWREVTLPAGARNGVRFPSGTTGPVVVKVTVADLAGNTGEGQKEIAAAAGAPLQTSTSMSPAPPEAGLALPSPPAVAVAPAAAAAPAAGPIPPPDLTPPTPGFEPVAPTPPVAVAPPPPAVAAGMAAPPANPPAVAPAALPTSPPTAPVVSPVPAGPPAYAPQPLVATPAPVVPSGPTAVATFDPRNTVTPAAGASFPAHPPATPPGFPGPMVELTRAQVVNSLRFDLNYQVEQRGPSGISRVDLWVTRDDGRTWVWWSQHGGQEAALRVNLATPANTQPEGGYGFRLVPVSGAGLSEATPVSGDAPDIRLVVDVTPPAVRVFPPVSDPAFPDALVLQWEATDKNFGDDPITLEWSDSPAGPWRPVVSAGPVGESVVQVGTVAGAAPRRLPNTGRYPWRVPTGLPPRVYLKVTARDAAGNTTEQVTREPLLIDLTRPRAKITGVGAAPVVTRP